MPKILCGLSIDQTTIWNFYYHQLPPNLVQEIKVHLATGCPDCVGNFRAILSELMKEQKLFPSIPHPPLFNDNGQLGFEPLQETRRWIDLNSQSGNPEKIGHFFGDFRSQFRGMDLPFGFDNLTGVCLATGINVVEDSGLQDTLAIVSGQQEFENFWLIRWRPNSFQSHFAKTFILAYIFSTIWLRRFAEDYKSEYWQLAIALSATIINVYPHHSLIHPLDPIGILRAIAQKAQDNFLSESGSSERNKAGLPPLNPADGIITTDPIMF